MSCTEFGQFFSVKRCGLFNFTKGSTKKKLLNETLLTEMLSGLSVSVAFFAHRLRKMRNFVLCKKLSDILILLALIF